MKIFESQASTHSVPRSERKLRLLVTLGGTTCGVECAESFMHLKKIIKGGVDDQIR